jgi:hypothetical protein
MIRTKAPPPLSTQSKSRVLAWLEREVTSNALRAKIAEAADVDEKTLRIAVQKERKEWNPRVRTLEKLEAVIPHDWQPDSKRGRAAA